MDTCNQSQGGFLVTLTTWKRYRLQSRDNLSLLFRQKYTISDCQAGTSESAQLLIQIHVHLDVIQWASVRASAAAHFSNDEVSAPVVLENWARPTFKPHLSCLASTIIHQPSFSIYSGRPLEFTGRVIGLQRTEQEKMVMFRISSLPVVLCLLLQASFWTRSTLAAGVVQEETLAQEIQRRLMYTKKDYLADRDHYKEAPHDDDYYNYYYYDDYKDYQMKMMSKGKGMSSKGKGSSYKGKGMSSSYKGKGSSSKGKGMSSSYKGKGSSSKGKGSYGKGKGKGGGEY
eukprot:scaffold15108_cov180-Amphora_coffeaeformis.AAC.8